LKINYFAPLPSLERILEILSIKKSLSSICAKIMFVLESEKIIALFQEWPLELSSFSTVLISLSGIIRVSDEKT